MQIDLQIPFLLIKTAKDWNILPEYIVQLRESDKLKEALIAPNHS